MQWQYDPQKAQLEHKAQICAKFHKRKYHSFRTVVRKRKRDDRPSACRTDIIFPTNYNTRQYPRTILASGKKVHGSTS